MRSKGKASTEVADEPVEDCDIDEYSSDEDSQKKLSVPSSLRRKAAQINRSTASTGVTKQVGSDVLFSTDPTNGSRQKKTSSGVTKQVSSDVLFSPDPRNTSTQMTSSQKTARTGVTKQVGSDVLFSTDPRNASRQKTTSCGVTKQVTSDVLFSPDARNTSIQMTSNQHTSTQVTLTQNGEQNVAVNLTANAITASDCNDVVSDEGVWNK